MRLCPDNKIFRLLVHCWKQSTFKVKENNIFLAFTYFSKASGPNCCLANLREIISKTIEQGKPKETQKLTKF